MRPSTLRAAQRPADDPGGLVMARQRKVTVDDLVERGVALVREYANVETSKTAILKDLAATVVALRERFHTEDGRTDWAGRSHDYREAVARIYHDAGVPPDSLDGMQAALRYHVGNVLRDTAPPEELEDLGLKSARPVERVKETRSRLSALARLGAAADGTKRSDPLRLITGAEVALTKVSDVALGGVAEEAIEDLVTTLEAIVERASLILARLEPRRSRKRGGRRRLRAL